MTRSPAMHWIDGKAVGTAFLPSQDPANGQALGQYADGGAAEAQAADRKSVV